MCSMQQYSMWNTVMQCALLAFYFNLNIKTFFLLNMPNIIINMLNKNAQHMQFAYAVYIMHARAIDLKFRSINICIYFKLMFSYFFFLLFRKIKYKLK